MVRRYLLLMVVLLAFAVPGFAATYTVQNNKGNNDTMDASCSLYEAMQLAFLADGTTVNDCGTSSAAPNTINFDGDYDIYLSITLPSVVNALTIDGSGHAIFLSGGTSGDSIFILPSASSNLMLNSLSVYEADNSAIRIEIATGALTATDVGFGFNNAPNGGAILGSGVIRLTSSIFIRNRANTGDGGAIYYTGNDLTIIDSVFGDIDVPNEAANNGGAIYIDSPSADGVFRITNSIFFENIANGDGNNGQRGGGAIYAQTNSASTVIFAIVSSYFTGNQAPNGAGGAILLSSNARLAFPDGLMTQADLLNGGIYASHFEGNNAGGPGNVEGSTRQGSGGAIYARGRLTVVSSSFAGNVSQNAGGGAISFNGSSSDLLTLGNVTFNNNNAAQDGGAVLNNDQSKVEIINSTIAGNIATGSGSGIANDNATVGDFTVQNSIIANNAGDNCGGNPVTNQGNNLQFNPNSGCGATAFTVGDPVLGVPVINPGANIIVLTMALDNTSAALNAGSNSVCSSGPIFNFDARGLPTIRPAGQPNCDLGAYESNYAPAALDVTPNGGLAFGNVTTGTTSGVMTATVTNPGGATATNLVVNVTGTGFAIVTNNCGSSLAAGANCTVDLTFSPAADGAQNGMLTATADGELSDSITLSGTGVSPALDVTPNGGLAFGNVTTGTTSGVMTATVTNTGGQTATNLMVNVSGTGFAIATNNCGSSLAAKASCTVDLTFSPAADGVQNGMLTATADGELSDSIALSGTGVSPALDVTPNGGLAFGNVTTGTTSGVMTATVTNPGGATATNLVVNIMGTGFAIVTNNCGSSLAAGANCTVDLTFSPAVDGAQNGMLTATADGELSDSIALSGTGVSPALDVTPDSGLAFGNVTTGTTSSAMTATVTNTGAQTATNLVVNVTGIGFAIATNNCGSSLAAKASCTVDLTFSPAADGVQNGMLTATADGELSDSIALSGTGVSPALDVTPDSGLAFGNVTTGTTSAVMTATVTNTGAQTATNLVVNVTGTGFAIVTNNCGSSLAAKASCTVDLTFSPAVDGAQNGMLTATADGNLTDSIALSGMGVSPALDVTPDSGLAFGNVTTGTTSGVMTATVTNLGGATATNLMVSASGAGFAIATNNCGNSLAAGANCTVDLTFSPAVDGAQNGMLTATADGELSDSITLSGTGVSPALDVTPDSGLAFGNVTTGTTSSAMTATVTNTGAQTATNLVVNVTGTGFAIVTNNCGSSLAAGANCTVDVTFSPSADGAQNGMLTATADRGLTDGITLTGIGITPAALDVTPDAGLNFGTVLKTSKANSILTATVTNTGGSTATNLMISVSGSSFAIDSNHCGNALDAGASCTVDVTFTPISEGVQTGTLTATADGNLTDSIPLTGIGVVPVALDVTPDSGLAFGNVTTGTTSDVLTATVSITGNQAADNLVVSVTGSGFAIATNHCGNSLAAGASCTVDVTFTPAADGAQTGTLTATADGGLTDSIALSGTGVTAGTIGLVATPPLLDFGIVPIGSNSSPLTATVTNTGSSDIAVLTLTLTPGFTRNGGTCTTTLAAGASCTVIIEFLPTTGGNQTGLLTAAADNGASDTVNLVGFVLVPAEPIPTLTLVAQLAVWLSLIALAGLQLRRRH